MNLTVRPSRRSRPIAASRSSSRMPSASMWMPTISAWCPRIVRIEPVKVGTSLMTTSPGSRSAAQMRSIAPAAPFVRRKFVGTGGDPGRARSSGRSPRAAARSRGRRRRRGVHRRACRGHAHRLEEGVLRLGRCIGDAAREGDRRALRSRPLPPRPQSVVLPEVRPRRRALTYPPGRARARARRSAWPFRGWRLPLPGPTRAWSCRRVYDSSAQVDLRDVPVPGRGFRARDVGVFCRSADGPSAGTPFAAPGNCIVDRYSDDR